VSTIQGVEEFSNIDLQHPSTLHIHEMVPEGIQLRVSAHRDHQDRRIVIAKIGPS
jgi:hypothetical protein